MKKNILLIESDNDSLLLLKEILEEKGYCVFGTTIIENAFDIMIQGIKIDIIFASTYIENAERYTIIKRFKDHRLSADLPIIAITQSAETNEGFRSIQEGCTAYVSKPIDEAALDVLIEKYF